MADGNARLTEITVREGIATAVYLALLLSAESENVRTEIHHPAFAADAVRLADALLAALRGGPRGNAK